MVELAFDVPRQHMDVIYNGIDTDMFRLTFVDRPRQQLRLAPRLLRRYGLSTRVRFT